MCIPRLSRARIFWKALPYFQGKTAFLQLFLMGFNRFLGAFLSFLRFFLPFFGVKSWYFLEDRNTFDFMIDFVKIYQKVVKIVVKALMTLVFKRVVGFSPVIRIKKTLESTSRCEVLFSLILCGL